MIPIRDITARQVIFDLDGTMIDSAPALPTSRLLATLRQARRPADLWAIRELRYLFFGGFNTLVG